MKIRISAMLIFLCVTILFSCTRSPQPCETCKGTGKIVSSASIPLPFEIVKHSVTDMGFFNPDYIAEVGVENKGDKDGTFKIYVDFIYKDIGQKTVEGDVFVKAHSIASTKIRYDADKRADEVRYRVEPPIVVQSKESICPTCQGKGIK